MQFFTVIFFSFTFVTCVLCQNANNVTVSDEVTTPTKTGRYSSSAIISSSTSTPINASDSVCEKHNNDCEKCIGSTSNQCFFCETTKKCHKFSLGTLVSVKECPLNKRYDRTCTWSLMWVMILVGIAAGVVVIGTIICCCCCCKKGGKIKLSKDDLKWARQKEERKARAEEKRQERAARTEEIRRKYGLFKDDSPYQRFDA